jgi:IS30 family transposase
MKPLYTHPSLDERREPFRLRSAQIPMWAIAQCLNRHPSTIYCEIKPNSFHDEEPLYRYPLHFGLPHIRAYSPFSN